MDFRAEATGETNPKSEYRNPKQTQSQINLKSGKFKTPNPKEACLEIYIFWSFDIVSSFGFRASNLLFFLAPFAPLRETIRFACGVAALVCCPGNSYTQPCKFCQYRVSGGGPAKRATVAVVGLDELIDATDQIFNTAEGSATNGALGDHGKPSFDLIKP